MSNNEQHLMTFQVGDITNIGKIEEIFPAHGQYKINNQYYHYSMVFLVEELSEQNEILLSNLRNTIRASGKIVLYHGTDKASAEKIKKEKIFGHNSADGNATNISFFTKSKSEASEYARNKALYRGQEAADSEVFKFSVPKFCVIKNNATTEYETGFQFTYENGELFPTKESLLRYLKERDGELSLHEEIKKFTQQNNTIPQTPTL